MVTHLGEGRISRVSVTPIPKGRGPALPNFGGSLLLMSTPFDAERPNSTW